MKQETVSKVLVAGRPKLATAFPNTFCPGCHYGLVQRILCEVIEELGIQGRAILVGDIGCNSFLMRSIAIDWMGCLHGRSLVGATGVKRALPDNVVFHIGGDGALGAIGAGHLINAMMRSEKVTTIFMNNAGYGMTGGQLAPTTLLGLRTTTCPEGRKAENIGFPLHVAELAATFKGTAYSARVSLHTPAHYQRAKRAVKTAFQKQMDGVGYSIVEIVSACPTDWGLDPVEATRFVGEKMLAEFPLGEFKNVDRIEYTVDAEVEKVGRIRR